MKLASVAIDSGLFRVRTEFQRRWECAVGKGFNEASRIRKASSSKFLPITDFAEVLGRLRDRSSESTAGQFSQGMAGLVGDG
jgi:hypothetical protein